MTTDDYDPWEDYQSGPFCRHWSDPADCDEICGRCGHTCMDHDWGYEGECDEVGCNCPTWEEGE